MGVRFGEGLSGAEAAELLRQHGPNQLVEKKPKPLWRRYLEQFKDTMVIVLIIAAAISAALGETVDAILIAIIVLMQGTLGFLEEYKAGQAFSALRKLVAQTARVVRDREVSLLDVRLIVPGDLILLEAGDRVPADGTVIGSSALAADESTLTGESVPVQKGEKDKLFMGTIIVSGKGAMVAKATGMATEIGRIAALVQEVKEEKTPLEKDLEKMGGQLAFGVLALCAVIFLAGVLRGIPLLDMFITAVSLAVAAIPEGLPAVVAIVLAIGVQRMSKRNAIIRKLKAVEALGSATVICTDKTGTLTRNEMVVKKAYVNGRLLDVSGIGYEPKGGFSAGGAPVPIGEEESLLLRICALCNTSFLKEDPRSGWSVIGDPTEGALLVLAAKGGTWQEQALEKRPEIAAFPFDSARKRMTTIHKEGGVKVAFSKGAPDMMLGLCGSIAENGKVRKLTDEERKKLDGVNDRLTSQGYRTLALAFRKLDGIPFSADKVERGLTFVGIVAMIDAPRDEARAALDLCKSAGIRVIMVTGDHKLTAKAVAEQLGIDSGVVVSGEDIDRMDERKLEGAVKSISVYARVTPEHKLRIVSALNRLGEVVAVTGDGVNDAPALKRADIGVAMGITGTDVAKESAGMILTDDNFATIVAAVEEGRGVYDNIKKTLIYLISGNIAEVAIVFLGMMLGLPLPLLAIQILWINLVTDGLPAIALSLEPIEKDAMARKPREKGASIWGGARVFLVEAPILVTASCLGLFVLALRAGRLSEGQTLVFTMLVMAESMIAFSARSLHKPVVSRLFSNRWLVGIVLLTLSLHIAILYVPFLSALFHVAPLPLSDWLLVTGLALLLFVYLEIRKSLCNR